MKKMIDDVMNKVDEMVGKANAELAVVVSGGFPFSFDEVKVCADTDSAAVYIHSGTTPICAVVRGGSPDRVLSEIEKAIVDIVDRTRTAVERRGAIEADARRIPAEDEEQNKARKALEDAGLSADLVKKPIDPKVAHAIFDVARNAVKKANTGLGLAYYSACPALGGIGNMKLTVRGYDSGLVVSAGGKPCLVTRYPKVANNKSVERTIAFIKADVAAINESRRRYFSWVADNVDREERLRDLSSRIDADENQLMAMMG